MKHQGNPKFASCTKRYGRLLSSLTLALLLTFTSCSNDEDLSTSDDNRSINQITDNESFTEISEFFINEFGPSELFDNTYRHLEFFEKEHVVINSAKDFSRYYKGDSPVPDIDFDHYTLIVGWVYVWDSNVVVENPYIENNKSYYKLKLPIVCHRDWICLCECMKTYYWSLFPKLSGKKIKTEIIKPGNCNY